MSVFHLLKNRRGSSSAEFALVLPLLLIFLFGIIDAGRFLWEFNRAEKATQMGARMAVVTDVVASDLVTNDYVGVDGLEEGDPIPASALGTITCDDTQCSCTGACEGIGGGRNSAAFTNIVDRMKVIDPSITAANVEVLYSGSGLGYAGDPSGMDVSPLVTVRLKELDFKPITLLLFANFRMPSFTTTLTAEDSVGNISN
jgi:hypothetical protein